MSDLPQRLRENVTMEYDRTDDVMLEAADRIKADEALLRQALEFCEFLWRNVPLNDYSDDMRRDLEAALRATLAEQAQPVKWNFSSFDDWWDQHGFFNAVAADQVNSKPLAKLAWDVSREMVRPPAPQPLTDKDIETVLVDIDTETKRLPPGLRNFARAVEAEVLKRAGLK